MSTYLHEVESGLAACLGEHMPGASLQDLYAAASHAALNEARPAWGAERTGKTACYFSAEFLLGRVVYANLLNLGRLDDMRRAFESQGLDPAMFETVEDAALGNGGLGRLAACFLDSAATEALRLDGYGIRYKYGLFRQYFEDGFQREAADNWQRFGDPWSECREEERVLVEFGDQKVWAVPYDMPIIGYGGKTVNNLRLWEAHPLHEFDFTRFNSGDFAGAYEEKMAAECIHSVLYPNDETPEGKRLRLKQQYFFASASLQSILRDFQQSHGEAWDELPGAYAIQLNDTHPTIAIPELMRLLMARHNLAFDEAFGIAKRLFGYTNHTVLAEALERWDIDLFTAVAPEVYPYVVMINDHLRRTLLAHGIPAEVLHQYEITTGGQIHMARMAVYASHSTNGVARLHTEILKNDVLHEWYAIWPERFNNKTNGITQRRWLALCNPQLAHFITHRIGDGWLTNLDELEKLAAYADDTAVQDEFLGIKQAKKQELVQAIARYEDIDISADAIFDVQVKRLHEYKRQLMNAFSILDIYFRLKSGELTDFAPMTFLFGGKAAPGYARAKGIIKFINEIARMVNADGETNSLLQVVFVQNYSVSWAEQLIPAADVSEQISTAGTEASGTGNMKLMLNGAVTLGTYDGANIEIVEAAGEENNYIFGARVEDLAEIAPEYSPRAIYEANPRLKRVVDALVDGTLSDDGTGLFRDIYDSLLVGASWQPADNYYLLLDFDSYVDAKLRVNRDWQNRRDFARKCLLNIANAGRFSSDRTVREYAFDIWGLV